jgi:hypothetical protein
MSRLKCSESLLARSLVSTGLLLSGCSFHASYESSSGESQRRVRAPSAQAADNDAQRREHVRRDGRVVHAPPADQSVPAVPVASAPATHEAPVVRAPSANGSPSPDNDAEARRTRERERQRRQAEADANLARIERETQERTAQAERDAAEQERAAEAESARARKQAEENLKVSLGTAAMSPTGKTEGPSRTPLHKDPDRALPSGMEPRDQRALATKNDAITRAEAEKKAAIRKRLEQNKADILVAAEKKRNEVHAAIKADAEQKP